MKLSFPTGIQKLLQIFGFETVLESGRRRPIPTPARLVFGLVVLEVVGTLLLMLPGMGTTRSLAVNEALFTATSALAVTGLSVIVPSQALSLMGQIALVCLIQIGGVGFMVLAVLIFRLLGRRVTMLDRQALCNSLGLVDPEAILKLTGQVLVTVLAIEGIGASFLWLNWQQALGPLRALHYAIFHAISAFCNAGFDLFVGLPEYPNGLPNDDFTLIVLGSLIVLGGLGIPVLGDLITWQRNRTLSLHTRVTLVVVAVLICGGGVGILLSEMLAGQVLLNEPLHRQILLSFFHSISARTAGFAGVPIEFLSPPSQLILMILMFIGASPASMGGGITTGTFAVLVIALWGVVRELPAVPIGGRSLSPDMPRKAGAVLVTSLFLVLSSTWLILLSHDIDLPAALFEVVSAFATCGLTLAFTSQLNLMGQLIIIFVMFWGRLGALTIILALAQQQARQLLVYPEEQILIG
jgi:trk system potassium uptake protein TrkH